MLHNLVKYLDRAGQNEVSETERAGNFLSDETSVNRDNLNEGAAYIGTELFASVVVGALLGWFVGQLFGIKSFWPLMTGIAVGAVAGFREIYRYIRREIERERAKDKRRGSESAERPRV